jgi:hypothetical protein
VATLRSEARRFFGSKVGLSLTPKAGSFAVSAEGDRTLVRFVLTLAWRVPPTPRPAECGHVAPDGRWVEQPGLLEHRADVTAELTLDASARIVAYDEHPAPPRHLKVETTDPGVPAFRVLPGKPARLADPTAPLVASGTVVDDLGDAFTCSEGGETDTVRRVRVGGDVLWVLDSWRWDTGHNIVGEDLLVAAP